MSILVFYNDLDGISNNYNVILSNKQNKLNGWNLKDWWVEWVASWSKAQFIHCSLIPSVSKKFLTGAFQTPTVHCPNHLQICYNCTVDSFSSSLNGVTGPSTSSASLKSFDASSTGSEFTTFPFSSGKFRVGM